MMGKMGFLPVELEDGLGVLKSTTHPLPFLLVPPGLAMGDEGNLESGLG